MPVRTDNIPVTIVILAGARLARVAATAWRVPERASWSDLFRNIFCKISFLMQPALPSPWCRVRLPRRCTLLSLMPIIGFAPGVHL
jgi:hypothetical protein